jgi:hypothetical protein
VLALLPALSVERGSSKDFVCWVDVLTWVICAYDADGRGRDVRNRVRDEELENLIDEYCESTNMNAMIKAKKTRRFLLFEQEEDGD